MTATDHSAVRNRRRRLLPHFLASPAGIRGPIRLWRLVGILAGEGIGAEVVGAARDVLDRVRARTQRPVDISVGGKIGRPAQAECGTALSDEVIEFCDSVFAGSGAILCGPGGGRFVYDLRAHFALYCKLTPGAPPRADRRCVHPASGTAARCGPDRGARKRRGPLLRALRRSSRARTGPRSSTAPIATARCGGFCARARPGPPAARAAGAGAQAGRHSGDQHTVAARTSSSSPPERASRAMCSKSTMPPTS
jgi:hypothetical protein